MRNNVFTILILSCLFASALATASETWAPVEESSIRTAGLKILKPEKSIVYSMDESMLQAVLGNLPADPSLGRNMVLPTPNGSFRQFRVWLDPVMEPGLAEKYPGIRTFSGVAIDNPAVTVKLDYTQFGFHAMVMDGNATYFIDPYTNRNDSYYICYFKKDYRLPEGSGMICEIGEESAPHTAEAIHVGGPKLPPMQYKINGATKKTYRLAVACSGEYAVAVAGVNPTKADVLAKIITSVNRVSGVYERELAVHLSLIANNDTIIFLDAAADPYSNNSNSALLGQNQNTITTYIGAANYDIGHVFTTGGGGIASLGCVCDTFNKARGVTGRSNPVGDPFDIDYVAHEMGHQFGGSHTFNANTGSCNSNGSQSNAYEPGSGSTIMAYAGICGSGDNLQPNSDAYFHANSLNQITNYVNYVNGGAMCGISEPSGNTPPVLPAFTATYAIPHRTPFELTAPLADDADHDTLTYCWEQYNRGNYKQSFSAVRMLGPIFRSIAPDTSPTRIFPEISKVLQGVTSYLGERLPDTSRYLTFRLTVRDIFNGIGTFNFPTDSIHLDVTHLAGPFKVTSQAAPVSYTGSTPATITWDVAGTDQPPVSADSVVIYLSVDGGYSWPYVLHEGTPNDGDETVMMPNMQTIHTARIKVKGKNNVFFNVSTSNFSIDYNTAIPKVSWENEVLVFPVPAMNELTIKSNLSGALESVMVNPVGQVVWKGKVQNQETIRVRGWAKGVYYLQLVNGKGEKLVKPVSIQ